MKTIEEYLTVAGVGLGGVLVYYAMHAEGEEPAALLGNRRVLRYGWTTRTVAVSVFLLSLYVFRNFLPLGGGWLAAGATIGLSFVLASAACCYQVFLTRVGYDQENLYLGGAIGQERAIAWSKISRVYYSGFFQSIVFVDSFGRKGRCSILRCGARDLIAFLNGTDDVPDKREQTRE